MTGPDSAPERRGAIAWMAGNRVAANLMMIFFIFGGLFFATQVKQEVFPEVDLNIVTIQVALPAATPAEVEQGVLLAIEEAVQGLDGVKEVRATALEGLGVVNVELFTFADADEALNDIQSAVDRITSFPQDAEQPIIKLATNRQQVISLMLYGDTDQQTLKRVSEQVRSDLLRMSNITLVKIDGLPPPEISIEVPQENLRRYNLTLPDIARIVRNASVDLSAGEIEAPDQETAVRVTERRRTGDAFRDVAVVTTPEGNRVTLGQIATIIDGFRDADERAYFDGQLAAQIKVFRVGEQTPIDIAQSVKQYRDRLQGRLPEQLSVAVWNDESEIYADRIGLLTENGRLGALLVLVILGLFLHLRVAFWVTMGMPVAFLGAFLFMPLFDVSINMISLFAFLLVLGIVVDDAIVVGEATYSQMDAGKSRLDAAIDGAHEVMQPVLFAVSTSVIAFTPMLFVPGVAGEFFRNIPLIVIPILILSLLESFFILPAHLGSGKPRKSPQAVIRKANQYQQKIADGLERFVHHVYQPFIRLAVTYRYLTIAVSAAVLMVAVGSVMGGRIAFNFFPQLQGDIVSAQLELPVGTSLSQTQNVMERVVEAAQTVIKQDSKDGDNISEGIYARLGRGGAGQDDGEDAGVGTTGSHVASIAVALIPTGERALSAREVSQRWREAVGAIPGIDRLVFNYNLGPSAGAEVGIELAHDDRVVLREAATRLAERMGQYAGVVDIDEGFSEGKEEIQLQLKPAARVLGITETALAQQVRGAFFGIEALREQRGRDELRVYVRLPDRQTDSEYALEQLVIQTPKGGQIPLRQAATIQRGQSFTEITRENGRRVVDVTADVDPGVTSGGEVTGNLQNDVLPELMERYPGLSYELSGEQQEQRRTLTSLAQGMLFALFAMYVLLAVAFRSYALPLVVLSAIPFGMVGALLGHLLMGYDLSLISMFGIVALAGVVVNDSLVLVYAINDFRNRPDKSLYEGIIAGCIRRFRPVLLTSLTTFFGLAPMIFETSLQARFLIPMAISLGFGVLFVTLIVLVIVPAGYHIVEDVKSFFQRGEPEPSSGQTPEKRGADA
jgi:multidrug efflux pump subunit AcrB